MAAHTGELRCCEREDWPHEHNCTLAPPFLKEAVEAACSTTHGGEGKFAMFMRAHSSEQLLLRITQLLSADKLSWNLPRPARANLPLPRMALTKRFLYGHSRPLQKN